MRSTSRSSSSRRSARSPHNLANATNNRYTSQLYRISPYIKGEATDKINYELRVDNIWNRLNDTPTSFDGIPVSTSNSYTNQIIGKITRDPLPLGWQLDYNRSDVKFTDQSDSQIQELGRLRLLYQVDSELQVGVSGGYEDNRFPLTSYSGAIYGVGYRWRPSPILSSEGFWEHRYFGSLVCLQARLPHPFVGLERERFAADDELSRSSSRRYRRAATLPRC